MVRVAAEGLRHDLLEPGFDLVDRLAGREPRTVADPEDMRVDRERLLAERRIEDDIGRLAPDPGQFLQFFAGLRDFSAVIAD